MKKTMLYLVVTLFVSVFLSTDALAGLPRARAIAEKQAAQQKRIRQGIHQGSLTAAEARALKREQRKIRKLKKRFLADGVLNRAETRKLSVIQKRAGAHIGRLKHNRAVKPHLKAKRSRKNVLYTQIAAGQYAGRPV